MTRLFGQKRRRLMARVSVITLSRQLGSGGDRIATLLARRLAWQRIDRHIIEQAARISGSPEAALAETDELDLLGLRPSAEAQRSHRRQVEAVIREWADMGHVIIVGRASNVVLWHHPGAYHLKIVAPMARRIQRVMAQERISEDAAVNRIMASDRSRARLLRQAYGVDWLDPLYYDLVINVRAMAPDAHIDLILDAAQKKV